MIFDDLLYMRKGTNDLTLGYNPSRIEKIITADEWEIKAEALREIFRQTLGESSAVSCSLSPQIIEETDCKDHLRRKVAYSLEPDERICAYVRERGILIVAKCPYAIEWFKKHPESQDVVINVKTQPSVKTL